MRSWFQENGGSIILVILLAIVSLLAFVIGSEVAPPTNTGTARTSGVQHANDGNFHQVVLSADATVLVEFYADWCAPCKRMAPVLVDLAREVPEARIVKVNIDHSPKMATRYGITSVPSLKVFKNGSVIAEHKGTASKDRLKRLLGK
jgi:thioredoxin 1